MFGLPRAAFMQGMQFAPRQTGPGPERADPFVWGSGGERMSPEQVAEQKARADAMMAAGADFSPVGSWAEGLARASQGILGGIQARKANKAAEANAVESNAVIRALIGEDGKPGGRDVVVAAMMNPNISQAAREFAVAEWQRMNPQTPAPTEFERTLKAAGVVPGSPQWVQAMQAKARQTIDPEIIVPLAGGQGTYVGPRSGLMNVMGGGGPASSGQGGLPSTLPPDFDFGKGGQTQIASGGFPSLAPR